MSGGENDVGLRKISDMTRLGSIGILLLHFYYYCYSLFVDWNLHSPITDRLLKNTEATGLFNNFLYSKALALTLLLISMLGSKGKKEENAKWPTILMGLLMGATIYFGSTLLFHLTERGEVIGITYMIFCSGGFLILLGYGVRLSRLLHFQLSGDIFNSLNETFPQEERLLENEYSINLPARYNLKGRWRKSWINIINPFRGLLVLGTPGSGKTYFVIQQVIRQHIEKGFSMFVYDFKYDDLTRLTYNCFLQHKDKYKVPPSFFIVNFDKLDQSHRCNPLDPDSMRDITDATESARTILLGLNRDWINKQGDFFVESPINFLTAVIWFLRKHEGGKWCTLPHVIELMQIDYEQLFPLLNTEPEIEVLINPFISAYRNDAMEQLEGQIASAKIGMARLSSPQLYWVLSGNDFTLDINNPLAPKIVCIGNNPEKQQIYGAVLSLFVSRMIRQVNKKGALKSSLVFDEFPTIFFNNMDSLIATARSNKVSTTLGVQDFSQLKKDYGRDRADVLMNITGNVIAGQVMGDTAKQLSDRFGKILQDRESVSINRHDMSLNKSKHLDSAVPASKIATLSSGEFVGIVGDTPNEKIGLKMFHSQLIQDAQRITRQTFKCLPQKISISKQMIDDNYNQIKVDIRKLT